MKRVLDPIRVEWMDGKHWRLLDAFVFHLDSADGEEWVEVPRCFLTDFGSVPRPFWPLLPPTGAFAPAYLVHDKLYVAPVVRSETSARVIDRGEADGILREVLQVMGAPWIARQVIWSGVRVGGWVAWNSHRKADAAAVERDEAHA